MLRKPLFHCLMGMLWGALLLAFPAVAQQGAPQGGPTEICKNCHASQYESFAASKHGQPGNLRGPAARGSCLACHGQEALQHAKQGGGRGVGGIKNPGSKLMPADEKNATCLACHANNSARTHWEGSTHQVRGTACTSCHTMHSPDRVLVKVTQPEVCFNCHKQQRAEVSRTFRHPILEGKVVCSDCHNPHGSIGRALMKRDSVVETCYQCHAEKRGPFVHNHEPVEEDCALCHNPHGTVADSMLKLRPPFLCHQCHTPHGGFIAQLHGQNQDNPAFNPGNTRYGNLLSATSSGKNGINLTQGRSCLNCHTQIHGNNNPASGPAFGDPTPQFMFR